MHPIIERRHGRARRPIVLAITASLISVGAITGTATAADSGGGVDRVATAQGKERIAQTGALATAAPAPVHGTADDGTEFNGTFTVERFRERRGTLLAVGRLEGALGDRSVSRRVDMPVAGGSNEAPEAGLAQPHGFVGLQTPGACSILTLDLAPIDLNLLGLHVNLDEVHLLIEAIPGAGALLGNLLCAVVGLLDGGLLGGQLATLLTAITGLLNAILAF